MTVEQAQDKRKQGFYVLMSRNLKKVIAVSKDENEILSLLKTKRGTKMFGPLNKVVITKEDRVKAEIIHNLIWKNSSFGGLK